MENLEEYAERLKNIRRRNVGRQEFIKKNLYFNDNQWNLIIVFFGIILAVGMTVTIVLIVTRILK